MAAAVCIIQMLNLAERYPWLMLHDAELADAVVLVDDRITHRISGHEPLVPIAAVALIYNQFLLSQRLFILCFQSFRSYVFTIRLSIQTGSAYIFALVLR